MSLSVLSSRQGVERPPRTQELSVKPLTRLGLLQFQSFVGCILCFFKSSWRRRMSQTFGRTWAHICALSSKIGLSPAAANISPERCQQTFCKTGATIKNEASYWERWKKRIQDTVLPPPKTPKPLPPRNAHTANQFFRWGAPHPGTFMFDPWPLAHLESASKMRKFPFLLAPSRYTREALNNVCVCCQGRWESELWDAALVRCNERERDPRDGEKCYCSFWRRGLETWRQINIPAGAPGAFDVRGWSGHQRGASTNMPGWIF